VTAASDKGSHRTWARDELGSACRPRWPSQQRGRARGAGRVGGRRSGPGGVGSRGWSCLSPSPLGIGAGRRVIAQSGQDDHVQGLVEWRSTDRLRRTRTVCPEDAGMGRPRPAWRRRHRSGSDPDGTRHTAPRRRRSGPPVGVSSSGCQARTRAVMARVWAAASASRSWMRRARARRLAVVAMVSVSQGDLLPEPPAGADQARRGEISQPTAEGVRSSNDQRMRHRWRPGPPSGRPATPTTPHGGQRPLAGELVAAQRLAGRPDRIQGVGLGAVAAGGPLGPVQRDHSFGGHGGQVRA
jgi:hypothetical protein